MLDLVGQLAGPASHWVATLTSFVLELGFDTLVFWPSGDDQARQVRVFADEVVPVVRAEVARARAPSAGE